MLLSLAAIVASMVSIQVGAAIAKTLFPVLTPEGTTALRLVLGTGLLFVVLRPWRAARQLQAPGAFRALLAYGIALGVMNLLFYVALREIPLGVAVAIEFLGPLGVAVWNSRRPADFLWVGLAIAGLALLLPWPGAEIRLPLSGVLAALGAGAAWAAYIVFGYRLSNTMPDAASHGVAFGMVVAALVVVPPGIATAGTALLDPQWLPAALFVGLCSSAIPYPLEMFALKRLPARTFGILMSIEPALAAIAGLMILGERLTAIQGLAIASIVAASAGATYTAQKAGG